MSIKTGAYNGFRKRGGSSSKGYNYLYQSSSATSYRTGDDAWMLANYWVNFSAKDLTGVINPLDASDFKKVLNKNPFGSFDRFVTVSTNYVVDVHTGIGWYASLQSSDTWNNAIDNSLGSDFGGSNSQDGYTDWFLPNVMQLGQIADKDAPTFNYAPLNLNTGLLWSSTTYTASTTLGMQVQGNGVRELVDTKTNTDNYVFCRKHF